MRLGGIGSSAKDGYVEGLRSDGQWAGICDDEFDINDANVICRMLGFPYALRAYASSSDGGKSPAYDLYGPAPSGNNFVLSELKCTGNELSVFDCSHSVEWIEHCWANEIAGVQCKPSKL